MRDVLNWVVLAIFAMFAFAVATSAFALPANYGQ